MRFEVIVVVIMKAFHGCVLDRLFVRPDRSSRDAVLLSGDARSLIRRNAFRTYGPHRISQLRHCGTAVARRTCSCAQCPHRDRACLQRSAPQPSRCGNSPLSADCFAIACRATDGVSFEFLFRRLTTTGFGQSADAVALQTSVQRRPCEKFNAGLQRLKALI